MLTDLNAIENVWNLLRERLQETVPVQIESLEEFLVRWRRAVIWLSENCAHQLLKYCSNQKDRAQDVKNLWGAKGKW